jgi:hypothetical protein
MEQKMKHIIFSITLLCGLWAGNYIYAAQLHVLLANGKSSSPEIQKALDLNTKNMKEAALSLEKVLKVKVTVKELNGSQLTNDTISKWISQEVAIDDILFFYFTGKAEEFREKEDASGNSSFEWPLCNLQGNFEQIDFEECIDELSQKENRLQILIADVYTPRSSKGHKFLKSRPFAKALPKGTSGHEALFLRSKGTFVISAQTEGSISWAHSKGSLFTQIFIDCMKKEAHLPHSSWDHLFEKATDMYAEQSDEYVVKTLERNTR